MSVLEKDFGPVGHDKMMKELENVERTLVRFEHHLEEYEFSSDEFRILQGHVESFILAIPILKRLIRRAASDEQSKS